MYLRQSWTDPRLNFSTTSGVSAEYILPEDTIWLPDTFFRNSVSEVEYGVTTKNRLLKVKNNGDVWYVKR